MGTNGVERCTENQVQSPSNASSRATRGDIAYPSSCFPFPNSYLRCTAVRSGGNLEIMGLLLGKVDANVMVVMDSFALPVEGTETRVNAQAQA